MAEMTYLEAISLGLREEMQQDTSVFCLGEDIGAYGGAFKVTKGLIEEFRCPKCLNTNIAGSDAPIAQDLRRTVHKLVVTDGFTDQQVRDFLQERYGDFVLYKPPFTARTVVIWLMPVAIAVLGAIVLFLLLSRAREKRSVSLDAADRSRLQAILEED